MSLFCTTDNDEKVMGSHLFLFYKYFADMFNMMKGWKVDSKLLILQGKLGMHFIISD